VKSFFPSAVKFNLREVEVLIAGIQKFKQQNAQTVSFWPVAHHCTARRNYIFICGSVRHPEPRDLLSLAELVLVSFLYLQHF
jgi:hypothetical protein